MMADKERLAQALHGCALLDLESRARTGEFDREGIAKLVAALYMEMQKQEKAENHFAATLITKLRDRVIHGDYHKAE